MITQEIAREWARLVQFRVDVYVTFQRRADAVFELIDALAADTQARSPVELSLSPFSRRQYASIYDGLDAWVYDASALDKVLLDMLPPREAGGFCLWAVDETPRRRQYALTVADRAYVHYPNPVGNNRPITIGHNYGALVHIDLEGPSTWAPAWALERTPDWTGVDLALEQIVRLVRCDDGWHILVSESRGLSLKELRAAYLRRPVIEHFNRFIKQRLLFDVAQMGSVEQDQRWAEVVKLAYWQLYASRNVVECDVRPWERYKPRPPADQPATPSQTRRGFGRLLPDLGTPARAPQLRGKSPGRAKGYRPRPRERFPVVYKDRKQSASVT